MMRILSNQKIKILFTQIGICIVFFMLFMITVFLQTLTKAGERYEMALLQGEETAAVVRAVIMGEWRSALCIMLGAFLSGGAVIVFCWRYFKAQDGEVACAVVKIQELIAGNRDIRLTCDEEGELYRLFHEINSLAAILNAKAENEEKSKKFLQNTISDISHQLKTPLAALNIYNGIMQTEAETNDLETIREFTGLSEQELERIETLVQNLLKITKFDAGTIVMEKQQENVAELMAEVKKHFAFAPRRKGRKLSCRAVNPSFFYVIGTGSWRRSVILSKMHLIIRKAVTAYGSTGSSLCPRSAYGSGMTGVESIRRICIIFSKGSIGAGIPRIPRESVWDCRLPSL